MVIGALLIAGEGKEGTGLLILILISVTFSEPLLLLVVRVVDINLDFWVDLVCFGIRN